MSYCIEEIFEHEGLPCCVVFNELGFRCGYVGVQKNNSFWGMNYNDIYKKIENIVNVLDVHGGLTYSSKKPDDGYPYSTDNNTWWFGFDCGHIGDRPDKEAAKKCFPEKYAYEKHDLYSNEFGEKASIRTTQYVHDECIKLADWLSCCVEE